MKFCISHLVLRANNIEIEVWDLLYFLPIISIASDIRSYRAIYELVRIPQFLRNLLFGPPPLEIDYCPDNTTHGVSSSTTLQQMVTRHHPTTAADALNLIEHEIDWGSLTYLRNCLAHKDTRLSPSHFNGAVKSMRCIGSGDEDSSGMCFIHSPPGTGKTKTIITILRAIIHHSLHSHVGRPRYQSIPSQRQKLRCARECMPLLVLVVASSNAAVDNILWRLHEDGIPDGQGGRIYRQVVRMSRRNYEYPSDLNQYSLIRQCNRYDEYWHRRRYPTLAARRSFARTIIIFFLTLSSAESSQFLQLRQYVDVWIHDETAVSQESDRFIAMTNMRVSHGSERLFYISIREHRQLPALTLVPHMMKCAEISRSFKYERLGDSLFAKHD